MATLKVLFLSIVLMAGIATPVAAVEACVRGSLGEECVEDPWWLPIELPVDPDDRLLCISYNDREACAGYDLDAEEQPGAEHFVVCGPGWPLVCREVYLLGHHEVCIRWDMAPPDCFSVGDP